MRSKSAVVPDSSVPHKSSGLAYVKVEEVCLRRNRCACGDFSERRLRVKSRERQYQSVIIQVLDGKVRPGWAEVLCLSPLNLKTPICFPRWVWSLLEVASHQRVLLTTVVVGVVIVWGVVLRAWSGSYCNRSFLVFKVLGANSGSVNMEYTETARCGALVEVN